MPVSTFFEAKPRKPRLRADEERRMRSVLWVSLTGFLAAGLVMQTINARFWEERAGEYLKGWNSAENLLLGCESVEER